MPEEVFEMTEAEWEAADVESEGEDVLPGVEEVLGSTTVGGEGFRVNADIANRCPRWKGVRGCSDGDRPKASFFPTYEAWVQETIKAHPNNTPIAKGHGDIVWRYKNKTSSSGKRSCKGWIESAPVYVDFE